MGARIPSFGEDYVIFVSKDMPSLKRFMNYRAVMNSGDQFEVEDLIWKLC
ncbi:hypothetical protein L195_g037869 [Trifolium pratense]|uniref:Uncharacterized protein n=2 Tax=Trifolium pratense TaxID=57577 RepID=A0ACB0JFU9_TRIPR|nr:hypothetical protein L195_g037869 [Trifolium pratense]CAJ2642332.1 unnamed protein product [Trifolium pratense]